MCDIKYIQSKREVKKSPAGNGEPCPRILIILVTTHNKDIKTLMNERTPMDYNHNPNVFYYAHVLYAPVCMNASSSFRKQCILVLKYPL